MEPVWTNIYLDNQQLSLSLLPLRPFHYSPLHFWLPASWSWSQDQHQGSCGTSLEVQWLGLRAFPVKGEGSIPGQGSKIPQATWCSQKKKKKREKKENIKGAVRTSGQKAQSVVILPCPVSGLV